MRKFNIKVNGISYEVEVEEVKTVKAVQNKSEAHVAVKPTATPSPSTTTVAPTPVVANTPAVTVSTEATGAVKIAAPMPGTILNVNVDVGAAVKKGQVLLVLEAMKMENEITAPNDGVVASVNVQKGKSVNVGEILVSLN